jgi:lipoprotein-anchoring transpeptidase ErfK/SrfK
MNEPTTNNTNTNTNTNTREGLPASPTPTATTGANTANDLGLTLPLLDAFFAQENFEGQLKSKLKLTDQQVNSLKSIARSGTAKLHESDDEPYSGSAKAAREEAYQQIRAAIGDEKLQELKAFVNETWGGTAEPTPKAANAAGAIPQDTRVVVNIPAFRMDMFEDGKLIKSYKVGIGYPEFPLPTGLRKADTIIFRPSWTPPDEPWVEKPGSRVKVGQKIEPGDKLNPLGPIKIPIGLPSLIHGGKNPAKIGTFASHGCVGLTTPQIESFTELLARVGGNQLSKDQIAEYVKKGDEPRPVKLAKPIPVELRYETITVENGQLHIYRDVYDRGTNTEENLRRVLQAYGVSFDQLSETERTQVTAALNQMARGATGKPTEQPTSGKKATTGKVTSGIKGEKEVVIDMAALAGKGYPAPVDLDAGTAAKKPAQRSRRAK